MKFGEGGVAGAGDGHGHGAVLHGGCVVLWPGARKAVCEIGLAHCNSRVRRREGWIGGGRRHCRTSDRTFSVSCPATQDLIETKEEVRLLVFFFTVLNPRIDRAKAMRARGGGIVTDSTCAANLNILSFYLGG